MDDSPRHSKRRKLDTPSRNVSSPLPSKPHTPGTLKRPTRRIASHHAIESQASSPSADGSRSRRDLNDEKDVYDDIDGALDSPAKRLRDKIRGQIYNGDMLPNKPGSASRKTVGKMRRGVGAMNGATNGNTNGTPKGKSSPRTTASNTKTRALQDAEEATGTESEDELAAGFLTPSRRTTPKEVINSTNGKVTLSNPRTRTSTRLAASFNSNGTNGHTSPTPSRAKQRGQLPTNLSEQNSTESEEGLDLVDADAGAEQIAQRLSSEGLYLDAATKAQAKGRRQQNRADHDGNEHENGDGAGSPLLVQIEPAIGRRKRNRADHNEKVVSSHWEKHGLYGDSAGSVGTEEGQNELESNNEVILEDHDETNNEGVLEVPLESSPFLSARNQTLGKKSPDGSDKSLTLLKSIVIERLTAERPTPIMGLDDEYKNVHQLVENTVVAGEGNSMLVIGARGSGKTALVSKVLHEISKEHREEFHVVKLNGFIHTDDKLALREIWRQLGKEMELEEDSLGKNYADTLSKLLALLSHPSEQTGEDTEQVAKAVIFVMDEFDLFTTHPRQTLLYNLFDIAQSRKAPIAVLGLTARIDVSESLEKRVKSRFSHRYVHLSLPKTFTAFQEICKAALSLQPDDLGIKERAILSNSAVVTPKKTAKIPKPTDLLTAWNLSISTLFATKAFITSHLAPTYYRNKSIKEVLTSLLAPTSLLTTATFPPAPSAFFAATLSATTLSQALTPPDSKLALLPHLSHVQLALLIAAARLDIVLDTDTCNFNMAYAEYVSLAAKARMQSAAGGAVASGGATRVWGREVAMREWERLVRWELVVPVVGLGAGAGAAGAMVRVDLALEEIVPSVQAGGTMDRVLEKWCKQI